MKRALVFSAFENARKTGAVSSAPPKERTTSSIDWRRAAAPFALLGVCLGAFAQSHGAVAIKDAHVLTVSGEDLPKATVVMRDGLITEVGTTANVPADAWVSRVGCRSRAFAGRARAATR